MTGHRSWRDLKHKRDSAPGPCPECGSTDVHATMVDPSTEAKMSGLPDPLSYGSVAACQSCEHRWKPSSS